MKTAFVIVLILGLVPLTGCRTRKMVHTVEAARHSDSVSALRSIAARELVTESETTVVTMRPDTLGVLREVARDVVRTVTRTAENAIQGDTAVFTSQTTRHSTETKKTQETAPRAAAGPSMFLLGMWAAFALLAFGLMIYLAKTWTSRH